MPVFRYQCQTCGAVEPRLVPSAETQVLCRKCGGPTEKLPSVFAAPPSSAAGRCPKNGSCPGAGTPGCGCGCGCHGMNH